MNVNKLLNEALSLHQAGRLEEAEAVYRKILKKYPKSFEARSLLGTLCGQRGDYEQAIRQIDLALRINPNAAFAHANRGSALINLKKFEESLASFDRAIALQPDSAEAFNNRANALRGLNRLEDALANYEKAIALRVNYAEAFLGRGISLQDSGHWAEALASIDRAIALKPHYAEAYDQRGAALNQLKQPEDALACFDQAIALNPNYATAHHNRGVSLAGLMRLDEALTSFDRAIAIQPDYAEAYFNRGLALHELTRFDEALASYERAIALKPNFSEAYNNSGVTLTSLKRFDEALASHERAISIKPDYAEAYSGRGLALYELGRLNEALMSFERAFAAKPNLAEAYSNKGLVLHEMMRLDEALASYKLAILLKPDYAEAYHNQGNTLLELMRVDEALVSYERAIAIEANHARAHYGRSLCLLIAGRYPAGWQEFEWRWKGVASDVVPRSFECPQWEGEDLTGKEIFLYSEQGFGDSIQFLRYVPFVIASGGRVVLEVPPALLRLAQRIEGAVQVLPFGAGVPATDFHCPMMSLPRAFGTTVATIPAKVPYLTANPEQVAQWQRRVASLGGARVGLVWASGLRPHQPKTERTRRRKSITLAEFARLADLPGTSFVSLQKGPPAAETSSPPAGLLVYDWTDELNDFADTAALIQTLDLVISVDTAVAHLAGALGKPVWVLNRFEPDWRWPPDRGGSPWYPTLRQFRQSKPNDWDSVLADVRSALTELLAELRAGEAQSESAS